MKDLEEVISGRNASILPFVTDDTGRFHAKKTQQLIIEKELKFPSIDGRKVKVPEVLIETFVNSIKICADNVVEYNIRINPNAKVDIPVIPDEEFNPQFHSAKVYIDNTDAVLIKEISVSYEDAKNYANKRKKKVKRVHFDKPVTIRVYANL